MKKITRFACLVFLLVLSCHKVGDQPTSKEEAPSQPVGKETQTEEKGEVAEETFDRAPSLSLANVILRPGDEDAVTLAVEVATTAEERKQGLQGRESLGEKNGMWFVFENEEQHAFWMNNTPISLDLIFVNSDLVIVDIIGNAVPNSLDQLVPEKKCRYVLEVNAGFAQKFGIQLGDRVEYRLGP